VTSRRCSVCVHPERAGIDLLLARGASMAELGRQHGLSPHMLRYHKNNHLAYLLDPSVGLGPLDLIGIRTMQSRARRTVHKGS